MKKNRFWIILSLSAALSISTHQLLASNQDKDNDGVLNEVEVDDDGDRIPDCVEREKYQSDSDNDGVRNGLDSDDDSDDIKDTEDEFLLDHDNDGIPNALETKLVDSAHDDDRDGTRDRYEKAGYKADHDNDGISDSSDTDDDRDNLSDETEATDQLRDHDNDTWKDRKDTDDDNDGIVDLSETNCTAIYTATVLANTWTASLPVAAGGGSVGRNLVIDSAGILHGTWSVQDGVRHLNYGQSTDNGATWSIQEDFTNTTGSSQGGNITLGTDDSIHVAYNVTTNIGTAVYYQQSSDRGATWSTALQITDDATLDAATPAITVDQSDHIHITWHTGDADQTSGDYTKVFYAQSTDNGKNFSSPLQLSHNTVGHSAWPRSAIMGDGELIAIAWRSQSSADDWDIVVAVSTDGGSTFSEHFGMATSAVEWDPDLVVDRFGRIHLAAMVRENDMISIYYNQSDDFGLTWSTSVKLTDYYSRFPFWATNPDLDVFWLFWKDERDRVAPDLIQADVAGKYTTDFGNTWSVLDRATDEGTAEVRFPSPALGSNGTAYVLWSNEPVSSGTDEQVSITTRTITE